MLQEKQLFCEMWCSCWQTSLRNESLWWTPAMRLAEMGLCRIPAYARRVVCPLLTVQSSTRSCWRLYKTTHPRYVAFNKCKRHVSTDQGSRKGVCMSPDASIRPGAQLSILHSSCAFHNAVYAMCKALHILNTDAIPSSVCANVINFMSAGLAADDRKAILHDR